MRITQELESAFFGGEDFTNINQSTNSIDAYLNILRVYAKIEGAIVVLSDLPNYKSYVCIGMLGAQFGFQPDDNNILEISTIWEEDIFNKIHPEDLLKKHILELRFFCFLNKTPPNERMKFCTDSKIRMLNIDQDYQYVNHRTLYLYNSADKSLGLTLCIYKTSVNQTSIDGINGRIVDNKKGVVVEPRIYNDCSNLLSSREKDVLYHIQKGSLSKEIADMLSISQNTVSRHRQNILKKLGVNNSFEAIKIAEAMDLL